MTDRQVLERGPESERCSQTHLKREDFEWILRGGTKTSCAIPKFWELNSVAKIRASGWDCGWFLDVGYEQKVAPAKVWNFEELHSRA